MTSMTGRMCDLEIRIAYNFLPGPKDKALVQIRKAESDLPFRRLRRGRRLRVSWSKESVHCRVVVVVV